MISMSPRAILLVTGALLLAACETAVEMQVDEGPVETQRVNPFERQEDFTLKFAGANMGATTINEAALRNALYQFGVRNPDGAQSPNLRNLINRIERDSNRTNGLGGIQARAYVDAAALTLTGNRYGGPLDRLVSGDPPQWVKVTGQIQETVNGEPGFKIQLFQDANGNITGNGYLWVLMVTESRRGGSIKSFAQMFKAVISNQGLHVEPKVPMNDPNYPSNVFPQFAAESGLVINATTAADYNYKLWASGEDISVEAYWTYRNYNTSSPPPHDDPRWEKYTADTATPPLQNIFAPDPEACIDMMFAENPWDFPGGMLPELAKPPFYCLGRCENPPIINTR